MTHNSTLTSRPQAFSYTLPQSAVIVALSLAA